MSETEKRVLNTFSRILPHLPEEGKEKLLTLGEGIAIGAGVMNPEDCSSVSEKKQDKELGPV